MRVTPKAMLRFAMPKQGKPMAWPATLAAKVSQWPIAYEWRMNWTFRYTLYGMAVVFPIVWKIDSLVNSPAAKAAFKKAKHLEHEKEHEKHRWADISGRYANR